MGKECHGGISLKGNGSSLGCWFFHEEHQRRLTSTIKGCMLRIWYIPICGICLVNACIKGFLLGLFLAG